MSTLLSVPSSVRASLVDPNWRRTMEEEFAALIANNTWLFEMVQGKWIFKQKFNSDGSLKWYKVHWVLCGFTQRLGVNYDEALRPVLKPATVHTVLSLAISRS
jgi:hypothetical protein